MAEQQTTQKKGLRFWSRVTRTHALPQSVMPWLIGTLLAWSAGGQDLRYCWLTLIGLVCAHLGINLLDDFFDYRKGATDVRSELASSGIRARLGKCFYLLDGSLTPRQLLLLASAFCGIATAIGGFFFLVCGWPVAAIAGFAGLLSLFYSAPPLRLSYRGLGEFVVGLNMGLLIIVGNYYVLTGTVTAGVILTALPISLLVVNILHCHAIMDFAPDKASGRKSMAVALGSPKAGWVMMIVLLALTYSVVVAGVALGYLPTLSLVALLTIPMAVGLIGSMRKFIEHPEVVPQRKAWMGPMGDWEAIRKSDIAWFMIRWYTARNLLTAVALLLCLAWILSSRTS